MSKTTQSRSSFEGAKN